MHTSPPSLLLIVSQLLYINLTTYVRNLLKFLTSPLSYWIYWMRIYSYPTGKVDMVVGGAGTGGTIAGIGKKIKEVLPNCKVHYSYGYMCSYL